MNETERLVQAIENCDQAYLKADKPSRSHITLLSIYNYLFKLDAWNKGFETWQEFQERRTKKYCGWHIKDLITPACMGFEKWEERTNMAQPRWPVEFDNEGPLYFRPENYKERLAYYQDQWPWGKPSEDFLICQES
jgi:hypothetical protein